MSQLPPSMLHEGLRRQYPGLEVDVSPDETWIPIDLPDDLGDAVTEDIKAGLLRAAIPARDEPGPRRGPFKRHDRLVLTPERFHAQAQQWVDDCLRVDRGARCT